jgi:hypothetical protein
MQYRIISVGVTLALFAGCASAKVTESVSYQGPKLQRPARILVYDFTSNLDDMPDISPMKRQLTLFNEGLTPEQVEAGKKLGAQISSDLAAKIRDMGLTGVKALRMTQPKPGDLVIRGYFLTLKEGSASERMALGFGSGKSELKVRVEGYQMTSSGLKYLAGGEGDASSGKTPGAAVGVGVAIATANPIGLIVGAAAKGAGEVTGSETISGASDRITKLVAAKLQAAFERQGWI